MKSNIYLGLIIAILLVGGIFLIKGENKVKQVVATGEAQKIVFSMKEYNYYPETITVKANQPVEISLDESVYGCLKDFTIKEFGVHKYLAKPGDSVTFTPNKKGTFAFACSMGMAGGKIVVE